MPSLAKILDVAARPRDAGHPPALAYRRDIDGLRAVAVLPVVAYHLKMPLVHGGFVGVDVFFVISGFLITSILAREIENGKYSILGFYERRARRIFPALFFMVALSTLAAIFILFPPELVAYARSMIWNALFSSNNYFLESTNYFTNAGDTKPLIHTWSLAVEEQYYIVFPPLLYALLRWRGRHAAAIVLCSLGLLSLLLSALLLKGQPSTVFYLAPLRAWELLIGSVLALDVAPRAGARMREALAVIGMALIVVPVFLYKSSTPFPGLAALPPCLGAALVIHAGRTGETIVGRLLSWKPNVGMGLISYSLYLWHWPLIVFYRLQVNADFGLKEKLALFVAAIAVSAFSWAVIERPFRIRALLPNRKGMLAGALITMATTIALGIALIASQGLSARYPAHVTALAGYLDLDVHGSYRQGQCFLSNEEGDTARFDDRACLSIQPNVRNYLLLGDSHAAHLWPGLMTAYPQIHFLQANASGCKPILGGPGLDRCVALRERMLRDFVPHNRIDAVLLAGRWKKTDLAGLADTIRYLRRHTARVIVFGPIVEYRQPLPRLLADEALRHGSGLVDANRLAGLPALDKAVREAATDAGAEYVSVLDALCPAGRCATETDKGVPVQFDYGHLTPEGSFMVAEHWRHVEAFR